MGVEPTNNHEGLSFAALPFAYRAEMFFKKYPEQESNLQSLGSEPSRSAGWRIWA